MLESVEYSVLHDKSQNEYGTCPVFYKICVIFTFLTVKREQDAMHNILLHSTKVRNKILKITNLHTDHLPTFLRRTGWRGTGWGQGLMPTTSWANAG